MDRRALVGVVVGGLLVSRVVAHAQQPAKKLPTLGILAPAGGAQIGSGAVAALFQGLHDLGWIEGRNLLIEQRAVEAPHLTRAATELVRLKVDVILAAAGPASLNAAREATKTIPIVTVASSRDPIGTGLIQSYARPGGNITGLVTAPEELTGKQLEFLKTAIPSLSRAGFLHDATVGPLRLEKATVETSRALGTSPNGAMACKDVDDLLRAIPPNRGLRLTLQHAQCRFVMIGLRLWVAVISPSNPRSCDALDECVAAVCPGVALTFAARVPSGAAVADDLGIP